MSILATIVKKTTSKKLISHRFYTFYVDYDNNYNEK